MTVKQLIESLQKCDPDSNVEVAIMQFNKAWPVAYCKPEFVKSKENGHDTRIYVALPQQMRTSLSKVVP